MSIGQFFAWLALVAFIALVAIHPGCTSGNVDYVKAHAAAAWERQGFQIVGYEGYELGGQIAPSYGGACVWYTLKRIPDNGVLYDGCLSRWGAEVHSYSIHAFDAIGPKP